MELVSIGITVNLYSSVIYSKDKKVKLLKRAKDNNRYNRPRPEATEKAFEVSQIPSDVEGIEMDAGGYGIQWAEKFKNDPNGCPSFSELMDQLFQWFHNQTK